MLGRHNGQWPSDDRVTISKAIMWYSDGHTPHSPHYFSKEEQDILSILMREKGIYKGSAAKFNAGSITAFTKRNGTKNIDMLG